MELFPGRWYRGKTIGDFKLVAITTTSPKDKSPVFHCLLWGNETPTILTLDEIKQEKLKEI